MSQPIAITSPVVEALRPEETSASKTSSSAATGAKPNGPASLTPGERHRLIAETAYFLAASRGFQPGHELDDWLEAERQVDWSWTAATGVSPVDLPEEPA